MESHLTTTNNCTAYEQGGRVKSVCQKVSDNQPSLVAGATDATRFYWDRAGVPARGSTYLQVERDSEVLGS